MVLLDAPLLAVLEFAEFDGVQVVDSAVVHEAPTQLFVSVRCESDVSFEPFLMAELVGASQVFSDIFRRDQLPRSIYFFEDWQDTLKILMIFLIFPFFLTFIIKNDRNLFKFELFVVN